MSGSHLVRGVAGRPRSRMVASIQPSRTLRVTVTGCASPDPYRRMALVAASLTARTRSSTTSLGMAPGASAKLVRMARRSSARQVGEPAPSRPHPTWSTPEQAADPRCRLGASGPAGRSRSARGRTAQAGPARARGAQLPPDPVDDGAVVSPAAAALAVRGSSGASCAHALSVSSPRPTNPSVPPPVTSFQDWRKPPNSVGSEHTLVPCPPVKGPSGLISPC
jgi:hypothetical protein